MTEIKQIDWDEVNKNGLTGLSGTVYRLEPKLNVDRYAKAEQLIPQLEFGMNMSSVQAELNAIAGLFNQSRQMDGLVRFAKLQEKFVQISTRGDAMMRLAALYLNAPNEDRTDSSDAMIESKIADWRGYDYLGFFTLSISIINGLKDSLKTAAQNGLVKISPDSE